MNDDINVIALIKGKEHKERYIFTHEDGQEKDVLLRMGQFASHPELSFSWYDAAVLSQKIRQAEHASRAPVNRLEALR